MLSRGRPILEKGGARRANWRKWATPFERVLRSALSCEHLITDQAEAHVLIENAEGFADFVVAGELYRLDVVKHPRLSVFFKPVFPHQRWHPQPKLGNENCRSPLSLDGRRSPAR